MLTSTLIPAAIVAPLLVAALIALDRLLRSDVWNPWTGHAWAPADLAGRTVGRHRTGTLTVADIRAMQTRDAMDRLQALRAPLALTSAPDGQHGSLDMQVAGLPDREPIDAPLHVAGDIDAPENDNDTRELAKVA